MSSQISNLIEELSDRNRLSHNPYLVLALDEHMCLSIKEMIDNFYLNCTIPEFSNIVQSHPCLLLDFTKTKVNPLIMRNRLKVRIVKRNLTIQELRAWLRGKPYGKLPTYVEEFPNSLDINLGNPIHISDLIKDLKIGINGLKLDIMYCYQGEEPNDTIIKMIEESKEPKEAKETKESNGSKECKNQVEVLEKNIAKNPEEKETKEDTDSKEVIKSQKGVKDFQEENVLRDVMNILDSKENKETKNCKTNSFIYSKEEMMKIFSNTKISNPFSKEFMSENLKNPIISQEPIFNLENIRKKNEIILD